MGLTIDGNLTVYMIFLFPNKTTYSGASVCI